MTTFKPYAYQSQAIDWLMDKPRAGLFLDMGLGKSIITLTAIKRLMDYGEVSKVLIVAPKKVAESTWSTEAAKWSHTAALRVSRALGTQKQRIQALKADADIYVTNRDNYVWLMSYYGARLPFDMLVIDELTSFKSAGSLRFKAMKRSTGLYSRVVGLTGTPTPNGLIDLWAQIYCLDEGKRLGLFVTKYRDKYFHQRMWNNIVIKCTPREGAEQAINALIADICLCMQAKDYLDLPSLIEQVVPVQLSEKHLEAYKAFERDQVLKIADTDATVMAAAAAALLNKLSQFANGAIYDAEGNVHEIHSEKLIRLSELIEEAKGQPVLVFYQYKHDVPRIKRVLRDVKVEVYRDAETLERWNAGKIEVLLAHPASTAYGLNMQQGGHYIVWFGTGWDLELYLQANARLHRQGQQHPVVVCKLIATGTVDQRSNLALEQKETAQTALLNALKELRKQYVTK